LRNELNNPKLKAAYKTALGDYYDKLFKFGDMVDFVEAPQKGAFGKMQKGGDGSQTAYVIMETMSTPEMLKWGNVFKNLFDEKPNQFFTRSINDMTGVQKEVYLGLVRAGRILRGAEKEGERKKRAKDITGSMLKKAGDKK